jgi:hypothetical protein
MAQTQPDEMSVDENEKSERVVTYLTPDKKSAIETASGEQSVAAWVRDAVNTKLKNDQQEDILESTNAEQRIKALVAQAVDDLEASTGEAAAEIQQATQQYHDLLAINAVYSVGSFRLLGDYGDFSDPQRQAAIQAGVERLQESDVPELDLSALDSSNDARASESRAQDQQEGQPQQPQQPDLNPPSADADADDDDDDDGGLSFDDVT